MPVLSNKKTKFKAFIKCFLTFVLLCPLFIGFTGCDSPSSSGSSIVSVASREVRSYATGSDGEKYVSWMGLEPGTPWCACFVSYVCDQAGLKAGEDYPKSASTAEWKSWFQDERNSSAGTIKSKDETTPVAGDLFIQSFSNGSWDHIGIVESYDVETDKITTIEGNLANSVARGKYDAKSEDIAFYIHLNKTGTVSSGVNLAGCSSSSGTLGLGETIELPEGLGRTKSYMGWSTITNVSSNQYKLRESQGENYDENGFAQINGRYVIACTLKFGSVGDCIDWQLENGKVINTIIGDIKNYSDAGINEWGHNQGDCVIEFIVNTELWYNGGAKNPTGVGDPSAIYHTDEWYRQSVTKAVNCGSVFDQDSSSSSNSQFGLMGCSSGIYSSIDGEPNFSNADAWRNLNPYADSFMGQCTWFAWGRFYEIYGYSPGFTGNGYECVDQLVATHPDKFEKSSTPVAGAVGSSDTNHNHVWIVTRVDGDRITIQQGNLNGSTDSWEIAIQDWNTQTYSKAELEKAFGTCVFANPIKH